MFEYLILLATCSLTILYTNKIDRFEDTDNETVFENEIFTVKTPIWPVVSNMSRRLTFLIDKARLKFEENILNSSIPLTNRPDEIVELMRAASPLMPLIIYTVACFLVIGAKPNDKHRKEKVSIWVLSILLIAINYKKYIDYLRVGEPNTALVSLPNNQLSFQLNFVLIIVPIIQLLAVANLFSCIGNFITSKTSKSKQKSRSSKPTLHQENKFQHPPNLGVCGNVKFNFDTLKSPHSYSLRKFVQSMITPYLFPPPVEPSKSTTTGFSDQKWLVPRKSPPGNNIIKPARLNIIDSSVVDNSSRFRKVPRSRDSTEDCSDSDSIISGISNLNLSPPNVAKTQRTSYISSSNCYSSFYQSDITLTNSRSPFDPSRASKYDGQRDVDEHSDCCSSDTIVTGLTNLYLYKKPRDQRQPSMFRSPEGDQNSNGWIKSLTKVSFPTVLITSNMIILAASIYVLYLKF